MNQYYHAERLNESHLSEWTVGSAVSEEIATLNIESLSAEELTERIKPKNAILTPGWWCRGVNWRTGQPMGLFFGQGKPDKPHVVDPDTKKTAKYMTSSGMEPDAIFLAMPDKDYWSKPHADKSIPVVWTEGVKKAGAGLSIGLLTIALTGVWNFGKNGELAPEIKRWAERGGRHILAFDSDYRDKPLCRKAISKLAFLLTDAGCEVRIASWSQEYKGMDDYIKANGNDAFKEVIANALSIEQWEKQFKKAKEDEKIPPADRIAREIAEQYREKLLFNNEIRQWMLYEADYPGVWSAQTDEYVESIVFGILDGKGICDYGTHSYIVNIVKNLRCINIASKWLERSPKEMLPFTNGVLEIKTRKLLPHSPGYRFTWHLPRNHDENATDWHKIDAFLDHLTSGNKDIKDLLICYCNAVVKGRQELQKFVHLIGLGGTGKGTFARLVVNLIGSENVHSTTLDDWCGNRFEGANAYRKRLVMFPDEDKQTGKLGKFLSLTGEDWIRAEEKGRKATNYRYDGMVLVLSNLPVFTGDSASRVKRRTITVPCNNTVPALKRRNLEAEFEPELGAFTNYLLSLSDDHVTNVMLGLKEIPECTLEFWENRVRVDSIAGWLNDCVIYDPMKETPIGSDRHEGEDNSRIITLFGSYNHYCHNEGSKPKSCKNFSPDLLELCNSVLNWQIELKATKTARIIRGLRLRVSGEDDNIPTYDYALMEKIKTGDGCDGSGDGSGDGSEPLQNKQGDGCDGTFFSRMGNENNLIAENTSSSIVENTSIYKERVEVYPSHPSPPLPQKSFDPSPDPSPHPSHPSSPVNSSELVIRLGGYADYAGERVEIWGWENNGKEVWVKSEGSQKPQLVKRGVLKPFVDKA